ncbi:MAG: lamin tail domain-containing protein, partial [Limisphaerales bacterium]
MPNHFPGWRALAVVIASLTVGTALPCPAQSLSVLIETNAAWRVFPGRVEPSPGDPAAWRSAPFPDDDWTVSNAPFWYGEAARFGGSGTELTGMQNSYSSIYLRREFQLSNPTAFSSFELSAVCDDGFIAWINGRQVAALNPPAGGPAHNAAAGGTAVEPVEYTRYSLPTAPGALTIGDNVLAVQVFNASLGSSDLVFDARLTASLPPSEFPTVANVNPTPGRRDSLDAITVVFSENVRGIRAEDFLINGVSAERVEGSGNTYTFHFPQPAFGPVEIRWGTLHQIENVANPPQRFEITAKGSVWGYELVDPLGPSLAALQPPPGSVLTAFTEALVRFDKAVAGIDASDLLRNGVPALAVSGIGAGPYRFTFPPSSPGPVALTFAPDHGIASDAADPRPFPGGAWSYLVNPSVQPPPLRITEFMAENLTALRDEDQDPEDWIEILNPTTTAVNLEGWSLSNEADDPERWVFPPVSLPARSRLVVHASAKDRRSAQSPARLHTNFKLNPNGGYLGLFAPELPRRAVSEIRFPEQGPNHAYGRENDVGE